MAEIKIRFITQSGFVSAMIRKTTFSEFSHTEIELQDGTFLGAHAGSGIQIRPADYCKPTFERRYSLRCTDAQLATGMTFARSKIGIRYDYKDIIGLFFHTKMGSPSKFICSEFVCDVLINMGIYPLNVLPKYSYLVTPDTLHLSPIFLRHCYFQTARPE
jgi:hypothetical protein